MKTKTHHGNGRHKQNGRPNKDENKEVMKDLAATYNQFKEFEGQKYTGMKIGRSHKWYYDQGEWKEKKVTPDKWEFNYAVVKRRAGRAPEGSGVPVGTEYHWYILAHQNVRKLNANDYTTSMTGMKFKVAHKRADTGKWSASDRARRNRLIKLLRETADDLEKQQVQEQAQPRAKATRVKAPVQSDGRASRPRGKKAKTRQGELIAV